MDFKLVLQWPQGAFADLDELVELEDALIAAVGDEGTVDGHDMGSGEANIFILTGTPVPLFERLRPCLPKGELSFTLKAAFRNVRGEKYTCLWPPELTQFRVT